MNSNPNKTPGEKDTDHLEQNKQLKENQPIKSDEDLHQEESGNIAEPEAQKNKLDGPANDLIGQPAADDDQ